MDKFLTVNNKRKLEDSNVTNPNMKRRKEGSKDQHVKIVFEKNDTTAARLNLKNATNSSKPSQERKTKEKLKILQKSKNSITKKTSTGGKSRNKAKEPNIQKTKITSFFAPNQPVKPGLATGGGVEQHHIQWGRNSKQLEWSSGVGGVGRSNQQADKGVGDGLVTFSFITSTNSCTAEA